MKLSTQKLRTNIFSILSLYTKEDLRQNNVTQTSNNSLLVIDAQRASFLNKHSIDFITVHYSQPQPQTFVLRFNTESFTISPLIVGYGPLIVVNI